MKDNNETNEKKEKAFEGKETPKTDKNEKTEKKEKKAKKMKNSLRLIFCSLANKQETHPMPIEAISPYNVAAKEESFPASSNITRDILTTPTIEVSFTISINRTRE